MKTTLQVLVSGFAVGFGGCIVQAPPPAQPAPQVVAAEPVAVTPTPAATPAPANTAAAAPAPATTATAAVAAPLFDPNGAADPSKTLAYQEAPEATEAPVEVKILSADGRPREFRAGSADALYIWQDAKGTRWHVRTTTTGAWHRFHGAIIADSVLTGVRPTRVEWADRVHSGDKRIGFDLFTRGQVDGFDFNVAGDKCIRVAVAVDGKPQADKIKIGAGATSPARAHFKLCP